jgi:D-alanyl-lipoteichoic acid acyltransferase DltB (MBOAT superfamily)
VKVEITLNLVSCFIFLACYSFLKYAFAFLSLFFLLLFSFVCIGVFAAGMYVHHLMLVDCGGQKRDIRSLGTGGTVGLVYVALLIKVKVYQFSDNLLGLSAIWRTSFIDISFLSFFFIRYFPQLHFQCYPKSPPNPPPLLPYFLALAFPCTGAYKVYMSNGPLFPVMAG